MSDIKVGDRVELRDAYLDVTYYVGVVTRLDGVVVDIAIDGGGKMTWAKACARVIAPTPTLETATGSDLDRVARDMLRLYRVPGTTDERFRADLLKMAPRHATVAASSVGDLIGRDGMRVRADKEAPASDPGVTQAEWSAAIAQINEQAKALDAVRKFLGSHSLAATSLQCQREAREVMGVVMRALDAARVGK